VAIYSLRLQVDIFPAPPQSFNCVKNGCFTKCEHSKHREFESSKIKN
jgi:hypothetical protein